MAVQNKIDISTEQNLMFCSTALIENKFSQS
jgi:hypothetical protein